MDLGTSLVTLGAAALVLLPRVPALTAEGRAKERIRGDLELLASMPGESAARAALAAQVESGVDQMLRDRDRDRFLERSWVWGTSLLGLGWLLLVLSKAPGTAGPMSQDLTFALVIAGAVASLLGLLQMGGAAVLALVRMIRRMRSRGRRGGDGPALATQ